MLKRLSICLTGAVQGVGFRPFVYRIANELNLKGFVLNNSSGVIIEVEGSSDAIDRFLLRLNSERPPLSHIFSQEITFKEPSGFDDFQIRESSSEGIKEVTVLPDIATCDLCLEELFDSANRRSMYPFINCTNCGPRFTIIERLPYDRPNTTMNSFKMCSECLAEYSNPSDRRFHAQPNACSICGPYISLFNSKGELISDGDEAIFRIIEEIKKGSIVAVKGIGGFHLICDAQNDEAVTNLRSRKRRQEKPFAVMFPDIENIKKYAFLLDIEEALLISPERPIVLVCRKQGALSSSVAPYLKRIGAFLPYSPIHHMILKGTGFPIVATSGNLSDEPIVKDNNEALEKLSRFADFILIHNRPIKTRCDDSVIKVIGGFPTVLRRSRGYAPLPVRVHFKLKRRVLAVGGFYKNTFAIGFDDKVIMSQHIGDLETIDAMNYFQEAVQHLCNIYDFEPEIIVHDLHPEYETTKWAVSQQGIEKIAIQHHFAHIISCMAENMIEGDVLGIAWDGTGYGEDGTIWGGEFLKCSYNGYERTAYFKPFRLIGGEKAVREPRRVALSILFEIFGEEWFDIDLPFLKSFSDRELKTLFNAWEKGLNSPYSSSAGRLFDAVASILDIRHILNYEGQAAMMIEDLYEPDIRDSYPFQIKDGIIDWTEMFRCIIRDKDKQKIPTRFINTLSEIILRVAKDTGLKRVCLSGGVFQNNPLVERTLELLSGEFQVFTNKKVPPNDGGISFGQAVYGGIKKQTSKECIDCFDDS